MMCFFPSGFAIVRCRKYFKKEADFWKNVFFQKLGWKLKKTGFQGLLRDKMRSGFWHAIINIWGMV
jgi:hypothetical protein